MFLSKKERAFREAYNAYYPVIFNVLYARLKNREDVEDICHEVFIGFYQKYDDIDDPRKWLFGALKYGISNFYRKKGASSTGMADIEQIENDINFAFENGMRDTRIIIGDALGDPRNFRDDGERALFDLVAVNGFTYAEAATQLGLTRRQAEYKYGIIAKRIMDYLRSRGISGMEDLA